MADTYRALAVLLSYPTNETAALMPAVRSALERERLVSTSVLRKLSSLLEELSSADLYDAQSRYVDLFDRTRSLSLQLYEHVHGESRDRGQAMVELLKLYSSRGLELTAKELPDHLPVFLEFLSQQPADEAAARRASSPADGAPRRGRGCPRRRRPNKPRRAPAPTARAAAWSHRTTRRPRRGAPR